MTTLDNRIPPPVVTALIALLMWIAARHLPGVDLALSWRIAVALPVLLIGIAICLSGVLSFHRARTTVNPLHPERASALVDGGIYQHTRNPMYLGFTIILVAWALALASPLTLLGIFAFVLYMNRFQITPEERALEALFGDDFVSYCEHVRRWV